MYIHSVILKNYRSIGTEKNKIILEPRITTIIGKNESGKSNVLEGLSKIRFFEYINDVFSKQTINRNNIEGEMSFDIILKPDNDEQKDENLSLDTRVIIKSLVCQVKCNKNQQAHSKPQQEYDSLTFCVGGC